MRLLGVSSTDIPHDYFARRLPNRHLGPLLKRMRQQEYLIMYENEIPTPEGEELYRMILLLQKLFLCSLHTEQLLRTL